MDVAKRVAELQAQIDSLKDLPPGITEALELVAQSNDHKYGSIRQDFVMYSGNLTVEWSGYIGKTSHAAPNLAGLLASMRMAKSEADVAAQLDAEDSETARLQAVALDADRERHAEALASQ